jgi:hypothetical protein
MKVWNKLSILAKYYLISFINLGLCSAILLVINVEFINLIFFLTAFVWHFALQTPGLKEKVMTNHHRLSFLAVVVRVNHYLQVFINLKNIPYATSFIRAISPAMFIFLLFILGGSGNILFTLLGSFCFEVVYVIVKKKSSPLVHISDLDIPPAIPTVEKSHE